MSEELNIELINLYNFYKSQENPPPLINTIKEYLINFEGINPDNIE
ncbi:MAG: hypothetical protein ACLQG5_08790 [Methanobacterium sp.]|jgi:hypothetical protein